VILRPSSAVANAQSGADAPLAADVVAKIHWFYAFMAQFLLRHFAGMPLITGSYPQGFDYPRTIRQHFHPDAKFGCTTDFIRTLGGELKPYLRLDEAALRYVVEHQIADEMFSWTPRPDDPHRAAYARFILAPNGKAGLEMQRAACLAMREVLNGGGLDCMVVLGAVQGAQLWVPLADGPRYDVFTEREALSRHEVVEVLPESERARLAPQALADADPGGKRFRVQRRKRRVSEGGERRDQLAVRRLVERERGPCLPRLAPGRDGGHRRPAHRPHGGERLWQRRSRPVSAAGTTLALPKLHLYPAHPGSFCLAALLAGYNHCR